MIREKVYDRNKVESIYYGGKEIWDKQKNEDYRIHENANHNLNNFLNTVVPEYRKDIPNKVQDHICKKTVFQNICNNRTN